MPTTPAQLVTTAWDALQAITESDVVPEDVRQAALNAQIQLGDAADNAGVPSPVDEAEVVESVVARIVADGWDEDDARELVWEVVYSAGRSTRLTGFRSTVRRMIAAEWTGR